MRKKLGWIHSHSNAAVALLPCVCRHRQPAPPAALTLKQAVENALRNYPSIQRLAGADQRGGGRNPARAHRLPAARGRAGAGEPRHPKQRLRAAAAAKRDPFHLRSGARHQQLRNRVGQRRRARWSPGSPSTSACAGRAWPSRQRRGRSRRRHSSEPSSRSRSPQRTPISRWSPRRRRCAPRRPAWIARKCLRGRIDALVNARVAARRGRFASRSRTGGRADPTDPAQQAVDVARATLSQFVGMEPAQIRSSPRGCFSCRRSGLSRRWTGRESIRCWSRTPSSNSPGAAPGPGALLFSALLPARRRLRPRTGAEINGTNLGGLNGLAPNVQNYALGFTVTFPVFDLPSIRAREAGQSADDPRRDRPRISRSRRNSRPLERGGRHLGRRPEGRRQHARPGRGRTRRGEQATARYQSGLGEHRRGRGSAAAAHAGRDRRRARAPRRLARPARRCRRGGRHPAVRCGGKPVTPLRE